MDDHKFLRRDWPRRGGGVVLHVREGLNCLEHVKSDGRVECLWVRTRGNTKKAGIMTGGCYRLPNQDHEVGVVFYRCLGKVLVSLALVLVRDFNLPGICPKYNTADRKQPQRFFKPMEGNFLTQLVLELLLANRKGLVNIKVGGQLEQSHQKMVKLGEESTELHPWTFGGQISTCSGKWLTASSERQS